MEITLDTYLNHLRHSAIVVAPNGEILLRNTAFDTLFFLGGTKISDIFQNNLLLLDAFKKVKASKNSYYVRDVAVKKDDGRIQNADVETLPLLNSQGELVAISLLFYDRTGRVPFEEHQKRIDRVNYLGTIAAGLAHEIRNPLSGIKGASQLLADSFQGDAETRQYAEIIEKEVDRVDHLVKDLLDFTKPRKIQKITMNINQVLHDLYLLQKTIDNDRITFLEEYDPSLPPIQADPQALSQVFLNLFKNARQAIKDKGKVIVRSKMITDFVLRKHDRKCQMISVEIEDTGAGIDAQSLANIFVPFFTTKAKGTGLGLALCHQMIEEHEGNIQVKSEKGKGTIFSVNLPV